MPFDSGRPMKGFDAELEALRVQVDRIDRQMLDLLNARAAVVADIYALKRKQGVQRFDRARTDAILQRLADASAGPLSPQDVHSLFAPLLKFFVERYSPPEEASAPAENSASR